MKHASTPSGHTDACLNHLMGELGLQALLGLTHSHAAAGQPALDLVLPILAERTDLNWSWLHHAFPGAHAVLDACAATLAALAGLDSWTARGIGDAIRASAEACAMPRVCIEELLRFAVLQHLSPLPLAEVMQVVGQARCIARLERVRTAFQRAQLIG